MSQVVGVPTPVDGTQLIGEMVGSGYRTPPALVRRADGQVLQLTPLLYLVLKAADGRRTPEEIADVVGRALGRAVTADNVATLVDAHLRPLGLLQGPDGSTPELKRSNPLVGLKPRVAVTSPEATRRLTDPFRALFRTPVVVAVMLAFTVVVGWVFFERGLAPAAYDAFERPHLLLLVFAVSVLSGGLHEFGHAAATRYSGGQPGAMGAGLYVVWPAFYTDVTDSYRLGRAGRIRTDLGGLYFNAVVAVLTFVWWWSTGWEALLLLVATQVLQMVQQLLPLLRFDGYHLLADLAGVPDLYQRIKPTLLGLLPHRWRSAENRALKPGARVLITLWVLVTVPLMVLMLLGLVAAVPRLLGSAGSAVGDNATAAGDAWAEGDVLGALGSGLQVLAVVLPVLATALILGRMGLRSAVGLTRWSRGSFVRRVAAVLVASLVTSVVAWSWWPGPGTYRPIGPEERGLVTSLLPGAAPAAAVGAPAPGAARAPVGAAAQARLDGSRPLVGTFAEDRPLPTRADPELALVLVPTDDAAEPAEPGSASGPSPTASPSASPTTDPTAPTDETWVFPFDRPLAPAQGDNQALAVNTTDGSVVYDVAFALVWADGDEVLNVNEAHAYASCTDCVSVAIAFQVVLVMDDAQVVVPQNLAVAANYECYDCITAAIANQLVLSLPGEPGEEDLRALAEVWGRLQQLAATITSYPLDEVVARLEAFKAEIVAILLDAPAVADASATASETPAATPTDATDAEPSASPADGASAEPSPTASPSSSPTAAPSPASSPTATTAPEGTTTTPAPEDGTGDGTGDTSGTAGTTGTTDGGSTGDTAP